jgi:hypothetical protein
MIRVWSPVGGSLNQIIVGNNLTNLILLHLVVLNNDRYFNSISNRRFKFYWQLIGGSRNLFYTQQATYRFLTSSNMEKNINLKSSVATKFNESTSFDFNFNHNRSNIEKRETLYLTNNKWFN